MRPHIAVLDYVVHEELSAFSAMGKLSKPEPAPEVAPLPVEKFLRDPASSPVIDKLQAQLVAQRQAELAAIATLPGHGFVLH